MNKSNLAMAVVVIPRGTTDITTEPRIGCHFHSFATLVWSVASTEQRQKRPGWPLFLVGFWCCCDKSNCDCNSSFPLQLLTAMSLHLPLPRSLCFFAGTVVRYGRYGNGNDNDRVACVFCRRRRRANLVQNGPYVCTFLGVCSVRTSKKDLKKDWQTDRTR